VNPCITRVIPECFRGCFVATKRYTNPRLYYFTYVDTALKQQASVSSVWSELWSSSWRSNRNDSTSLLARRRYRQHGQSYDVHLSTYVPLSGCRAYLHSIRGLLGTRTPCPEKGATLFCTLFHRFTRTAYLYSACLPWYNVMLTSLVHSSVKYSQQSQLRTRASVE